VRGLVSSCQEVAKSRKKSRVFGSNWDVFGQKSAVFGRKMGVKNGGFPKCARMHIAQIAYFNRSKETHYRDAEDAEKRRFF